MEAKGEIRLPEKYVIIYKSCETYMNSFRNFPNNHVLLTFGELGDRLRIPALLPSHSLARNKTVILSCGEKKGI